MAVGASFFFSSRAIHGGVPFLFLFRLSLDIDSDAFFLLKTHF